MPSDRCCLVYVFGQMVGASDYWILGRLGEAEFSTICHNLCNRVVVDDGKIKSKMWTAFVAGGARSRGIGVNHLCSLVSRRKLDDAVDHGIAVVGRRRLFRESPLCDWGPALLVSLRLARAVGSLASQPISQALGHGNGRHNVVCAVARRLLRYRYRRQQGGIQHHWAALQYVRSQPHRR